MEPPSEKDSDRSKETAAVGSSDVSARLLGRLSLSLPVLPAPQGPWTCTPGPLNLVCRGRVSSPGHVRRADEQGLFLSLCPLGPPHNHISLHDLVPPLWVSFLLASRKSQAGRAGDQEGRGGRGAEPIAGVQGAK